MVISCLLALIRTTNLTEWKPRGRSIKLVYYWYVLVKGVNIMPTLGKHITSIMLLRV